MANLGTDNPWLVGWLVSMVGSMTALVGWLVGVWLVNLRVLKVINFVNNFILHWASQAPGMGGAVGRV
jgi:hypothetical protein